MPKIFLILILAWLSLTSFALNAATSHFTSDDKLLHVAIPSKLSILKANNDEDYKSIALGNDAMGHYSIFTQGLHSVEWAPAHSGETFLSQYAQQPHRKGTFFNRYRSFLIEGHQLDELAIESTKVTTINKHKAYEIKGIAEKDNIVRHLIATLIVMPKMTVNVVSMIALNSDDTSQYELSNRFMRMTHYQLVGNIHGAKG